MRLDNLNPHQKKAVQATKGRVLVLAGAGSGKTSVLIHRIAYLIKNEGVSPESILGLTFTNKAAEEMRERIAKMIPKEVAKKITLSTFHSFCMRILRKEIERIGYTKKFSLYDEKDIKRLLMQLARDELEHEGELPSIEGIYQDISILRNDGTCKDAFTMKLYEQLQLSMRAYNALDFDSLISLTVKLFEEHPDVLEKYQNQFTHFMIDEYQDTNPMQYRLSDLLASKSQNLCVVGDDDQSIYAWRGADIKHILSFKADTTIKLEQNYRSTPMILNAANALIKNNVERHAKELHSANREEKKITVFHAPTEKDEAESVMQRLIHLKQEHGLKWNDMAILYRSNILSRSFEMALIETSWQREDKVWVRGIPYQIFGGTELFERTEVKDLMAYLRVIHNPQDQEALLRVINFPRRGISEQTLDLITQFNRTKKLPLITVLEDLDKYPELISEITKKGIQGIEKFITLMNQATDLMESEGLRKGLEWLVNEIDYAGAIAKEVKSEKMRTFKWENVLECFNALSHYEDEVQNPTLSDFLSNSLLNQRSRFKAKKGSEDKVNLMTFHSAKGLEFSACFLVGIEDHIIPHEKSLKEGGLEEERRLLYVAITRAKRFLTLSMARKRNRRGKEENSNPSRFLFEIPDNLLQVTSWKFF